MNKENPVITIITACFNSEKYIEQTIQSVINQTYDHIEYIIVDGKSTDATIAIIEKYKNEIDQVISEPDNGVYDAFNKAISLATGQYIMFVNSNDYLVSNEVIQEMMNEIIDRNYPVGIYGDILIKNEETGFVSISGQEITLDHFRHGKMPPHPATVLLKSVIEEFNGFNIRYKIASDFNLMLHIFKKYEKNIFYLPKVISTFRLGGLSGNIMVKEETAKIINAHFSDTIYSEVTTNENYMKKWIEKLLFKQESIGSYLTKKGISNVAIFGSGEWGLLIYKDLNNHDINTVVFLDNNPKRQGLSMNQISIESPNWLIKNQYQVDAIILGFQGNHLDEGKRQLNSLLIDSKIVIFDWRQILDSI